MCQPEEDGCSMLSIGFFLILPNNLELSLLACSVGGVRFSRHFYPKLNLQISENKSNVPLRTQEPTISTVLSI